MAKLGLDPGLLFLSADPVSHTSLTGIGLKTNGPRACLAAVVLVLDSVFWAVWGGVFFHFVTWMPFSRACTLQVTTIASSRGGFRHLYNLPGPQGIEFATLSCPAWPLKLVHRGENI